MSGSNNFAGICMCKIERIFTYNNTDMLSFSAHYPKVILCHNPVAQNNINNKIQTQVNGFYHYASNDLYQLAISDYKNSIENGFPFRQYDATMQYTVTYNRDNLLSLYSDQYTYTGGAHGNTVRASDTWSLESGKSIPLSDFFPPGQDYRSLLIEQITRQADERMQQDPGIFFENYQELIVEYFNDESYYLTSSGIDIYYQQYEIAPYSTGIVVFTIPYAQE